MTNQIPLDTFRKVMGYNPWHFWGLANEFIPLNSQCNTIITEYAYQNGEAGGRSEIRDAIALAEAKLRTFLQYPVVPTYQAETIAYPPYLDERIIRMWPTDPRGQWVSVQLPDGMVQAVGVESFDSLGDVALTFSDEFDTGFDDTFTLTVPTDETDPTKLAVYFSEADRFDDLELGDRWRVQPVDISIDAGVATITGRTWLIVEPLKYQKFTRVNPLDPSDAANFVTTLEVVVRTTDPDGNTVDTSQGAFIWDSIPQLNWWGFCCENSTDPASRARAIARVGLRNPELGIVFPGEAVYNETTQAWSMTLPPWSGLCRPPEQVTIRYLAGYPLDSKGNPNERLAKATIYLAMANLAERICACDAANRVLYRYQLPLNQTGTSQDTFAVTREMLNNPFGNRYGDWYAWSEVKNLRLVRGVN